VISIIQLLFVGFSISVVSAKIGVLQQIKLPYCTNGTAKKHQGLIVGFCPPISNLFGWPRGL
jgi:hypothetical protein